MIAVDAHRRCVSRCCCGHPPKPPHFLFFRPYYLFLVSSRTPTRLFADQELDLVEALDSARRMALKRADYAVDVQYLPIKFTAKNRMILGTPSYPSQSSCEKSDTVSSSSLSSSPSPRRLKLPMVTPSSTTTTSINSHQPNKSNRENDNINNNNHNHNHNNNNNININNINNSNRLGNLPFVISCADTTEARTKILELSGKIKSDQRKFSQLLETYATLDLSVWLPPHMDITTVSLSNLLRQIVDSSSSIAIYPVEVSIIDEYIDAAQTGRKSRTFRIQYSNIAPPSTAALTPPSASGVNTLPSTSISIATSTNTTAFSPTGAGATSSVATGVAAGAATATVATGAGATASTTVTTTPAPELILRDHAWKVHG